MINTREVASFIDNVIMETEEKEGYDEVVEEVSRKKFVYEAWEVQVESWENRVFGSSNWTRRNKNRAGKDKDSIRLANS